VKLKVRLADGLPGCVYYMTLLQSGGRKQQIHIGDFVYVAPADMVLPPGDCWMKHVDKLAIYSVDRLWSNARLARLYSILCLLILSHWLRSSFTKNLV